MTRLQEDAFLIVGGAETETRDFDWLRRHIEPGARCVLTNVTSGLGVISIMGPNARDLLQSVTPDDCSDRAFPFATSRSIELAYAIVRATRITYVGELGWEIYVPTEFMVGVYEELISAGTAHGLVHAGYHALNSLRIEKAYRHWGHDITDEETPLEAGLGFAVKFDKPGGFIGRDALLEQRRTGVRRRLVQFTLDSPEPLLYHNEPIWRGRTLVGHIRSGMYGHTLGAAVGLGYVSLPDGAAPGDIGAEDFEIEIAGRRHAARASLSPAVRSAQRTHQALTAVLAQPPETDKTMSIHKISPLAAGARKGYSLDRDFYCDDEIFARDMLEVAGRKWIVAGHVDRVRRKGDYFLYKIGDESIIVVRSDDDDDQRVLQRLPAPRLADLHRRRRAG